MDAVEEIWRNVPGYETEFQVSNFGRVRRKGHSGSKKKYIEAKILKIQSGTNFINTSLGGKHITLSVPEMVAEAFIPIPVGLERDKLIAMTILKNFDFSVENIQWVNINYRTKQPKPKVHYKKTADEKAKAAQKKMAIVQLRRNGGFVRRYYNIYELLGLHPTWQEDDILKCLNGDIKEAYGWKFMYEAEYEKK